MRQIGDIVEVADKDGRSIGKYKLTEVMESPTCELCADINCVIWDSERKGQFYVIWECQMVKEIIPSGVITPNTSAIWKF